MIIPEDVVRITVVIMEEYKDNLSCITLDIPERKNNLDIIDYLKKQNKVPFVSCFLTNKIAQKMQHVGSWKVSDVMNQCKQLPDKSYVFLCYATKTQPKQLKSSSQIIHQKSIKVSPKKQDDNTCQLM